MVTWTKVGKATGTSWTKVQKAPLSSVVSYLGGEPIGLLLALTQTTLSSTTADPWTRNPKASGTVWTNIPKAT